MKREVSTIHIDQENKGIRRLFCPLSLKFKVHTLSVMVTLLCVLSLNCHKSTLCLATSALKNYNNCYLRISEHEMCQLATSELAKRTERNNVAYA